MNSRALLAIGSLGIFLMSAFWVINGHSQDSDNESSNSPETESAGAESAENSSETLDSDLFEGIDLNSRSEIELAIERISPLVHDSFRTASSTYINLVRGDIGFIDSEALLNGDLQSLRELLTEHSGLTGASDDLDLEFVSTNPDPDGHILFYRQRFDGIPVDVRNSLVFDTKGHVSSLNSLIINASFASTGPQIQATEAITHASNALMNEIGQSIEDVSVSDVPSHQPNLFYGYVGDDVQLEPYWLMSVGSISRGISYSARVNAITGETILSSNIEDISARVCEQADAEEADCDDNPPDNPNRIWEEDSNGDEVCVGTNEECYGEDSERAWTPWQVLNRLEDLMESGQGSPPQCCDGVDGVGESGTVDVMIDETNTLQGGGTRHSPAYNKELGTIIIPPKSQTAASGYWKSGTDFATEQETLAHEGTHPIICSLNPDLCAPGQNAAETKEKTAMREGISDAVAALYSETYDLPGEDWVILDEISDHPDVAPRDLRTDTDFTENGEPTDPLAHRHGMVYAHAIYKMRQAGLPIDDLTAIITDLLVNISRVGGNNNAEYDYGDFADKLIKAAAKISSAAEDIAEDVVEEMTEPPMLPTTVEARFNDCIFTLYSFTGTWDSTYLRAGDYFEVEYSSNSGWIPWFEGGASCHAIHTAFPELLVRVKVVDEYGQDSGWFTVFAQGNCGGGSPF